jgi:methionyl-tRNA formyltransferase
MKKEDGLINWDKPAGDINNLVRGCVGWPGAFTYYKGKLLKIYRAKISSRVLEFSSSTPGKIIAISKEGIIVACAKDNLLIEELQIEGKKRMTAQEFIRGHKISVGEFFRKKYLQKE